MEAVGDPIQIVGLSGNPVALKVWLDLSSSIETIKDLFQFWGHGIISMLADEHTDTCDFGLSGRRHHPSRANHSTPTWFYPKGPG